MAGRALGVDVNSKIIEQIYMAAVDVGMWPDTMQSMQQMFRCTSAGMYSADIRQGKVSLVELRDIDPGYVHTYVDQWLRDNPWSDVPEFQVPGRIRTDQSLDMHYNRPGYYRGTAFFNDWMKPQNFIHSLGTNLLSDRDLQTKLYLYRTARAGPFSPVEIRRFKNLTGHLMRAVGVAHRLAIKESQVVQAFGVIDNLKFGVALLDGSQRLIQANRFAEALFNGKDGLQVRDAAVQATHRQDRRALESSIRAALLVHLGLSSELPQAASARRQSGKRPLRVMAIPLPRQAENPFLIRRAAVALMISDPELETVVPDQWLRHRYGLTAAEARLTQSLLRGASLREAAERNGLAYETARWYLKHVFQKTGTTRQPQLLKVLLSDQVLVSGAEPLRSDVS